MRIFENKDCMEGMKEYPDKFFDLAIVDPPYGIGIIKTGSVGGNNLGKAKEYGKREWDNSIPTREYFEEVKRVSKNQIIWGWNYFVPYLTSTMGYIVWDKDNTGNFADCETAWTSFDRAARIYKYRWNGMLQQNMKDKEARIHPTQKPASLYKWLLQNYSNIGDKILDTHVGSASSLIAFEEEGFDYVGFEIDKEYFDNANKRIEQYRSQLKLF
jgi:site-specific DNA-methyltransferase (adenine-specific)